MLYGRLLSNTNPQPVEGTYGFRRPGLEAVLPPEAAEGEELANSHPIGEGPLFRGAQTHIRWQAHRVTDLGVDVLVELRGSVFVDHVVLAGPAEQPGAGGHVRTAPGGAGSRETAGAPVGVHRVDVFVREVAGAPFRPAGGSAASAGPLTVSVGRTAAAVRLRLGTSFHDVELGEIQVWGSGPELPAVYPVPEVAELSDFHRLTVDGARITPEADDRTGDTAFAAEYLADGLERLCGPSDGSGPEIRLERGVPAAESAGEAQPMLHDTRRHFRDQPAAADAAAVEDFTIRINDNGVVIRSACRRGLLYGASALLQLVRDAGAKGGTPSLPHGSIEDGPATTLRGVHLGLPPREEIPFFKRLVRHVLVPCRYNTVFLEFAAGMAFHRHPEINEAWEQANREADAGRRPPVPHGEMVAGGSFLTRAEVADLVAFMKSFGLEVIPEVQSLSHVQYLTLSHPEIAEIPESAAAGGPVDLAEDDARPEGTAYHCYCAADGRARELVKDMMDEILDVVQPERYVHLGHDEVYEIGTCPRCRHRDKAELFRTDVLELDAHVRKRGLRSMIWADMLQPPRRYGTEGAITELPKDIVLLDFVWYFYLEDDIEDHLLENGFTVVMGNLYSSHYPRFTRRIRKPGMAGGQVSTWCRVDEHTLAAKGKLYDFLYTAEMLWDRRYDPRLRWSVDRSITALLPDLRRALSQRPNPLDVPGARMQPLDLASVPDGPAARVGPPTGIPSQVLIRGVPHPLSQPPVAVAAGENASSLPSLRRIPIGSVAAGLYFVHSCAAAYTPMSQIGRYRIRYADGHETVLPIEYGYCIADARRRYAAPLAHPAYRHFGYVATYAPDAAFQGTDPHGNDVTLYGFTWTSPRPDKPLDELVLEATEAEAEVPIQLWALSIIRTEPRE